MKFTFMHNNINVLDLDKSIDFYKEALGLTVANRMDAADGRFKIVFLTDSATAHQLELTWLSERTEPYDLGDNEIHLAMRVDDYEAALKKHKEMGYVCFENKEMGIYFIEDPDGYWTEIIPQR